jgi:acetolactate synthase small subunit
MFAEYRSHNDETLQYMQFCIHRINQLKEVFRVVRLINKNTGENQFNFPKFHILMHYPEFIKLYNCADGTDTEISEMEYRLIIKQPYDRTNKKNNFLK